MIDRELLIVVLAAGKGTRMKSDVAKVLHPIAGLSMLGHVLALAGSLEAARLAVVIGPGMDAVRDKVAALAPGATVHVQADQLGTGDAVQAARERIAGHRGDVLVLYGDTPLLRRETLTRMRAALGAGAGVAVLGFHAADPTGYGRLITTGQDGDLVAIREHNDASDAEREVGFCNSGVLGFDGAHLPALLDAIGNDNAKGEYYLTDTVAIARARGLTAVALVCDESEVLGINDRAQLAEAEAIYQARARTAAMAGGASMVAPETVFLCHDTVLGRDVSIEPNVFFGPGVRLGDGVTIRAYSHLEGTTVQPGAVIGPFARLRPGAEIGPGARIGNFVEVKQSSLAEGAKVNHLTYIGDTTIGAGANVGAGTITCNYDGFSKHRTEIGAGAFIGSNSALVAPVRIGAGAYVGSGSVISKNVAPEALALTRAKQTEREGWAGRYREVKLRAKRENGE